MQQQWVDVDYLASTHIRGAPDPRQAHPPEGQKLLVRWSFPRELFDEQMTLCITVRFWNNEQEILSYVTESRRSYADFFFPFEEKRGKILTYCVDAVSCDGAIVATWQHQLWTRLIEKG